MYEQIYESLTPVGPMNGSWHHLFYLYFWDAFLGITSTHYARLFRDGTIIFFGKRSGSLEALGSAGGTVAYCGLDGTLYPCFDLNGLPNQNIILNPNWKIPQGMRPKSMVHGTFVDEKQELYIWQIDKNRVGIYNLRNGQQVGEVVHNAGELFVTIAFVRENEVAGLCRVSGKVRIIRYAGNDLGVVETGRLNPFTAGAYDSQHHVFLTVGTDGKARNYCREAWPHTLSAPTFVDGKIYNLKGNRVRTRLTGEDGEPCPDWWVHWELEGVDGYPVLGHMDKPVSKTDKDGWAENIYLGPVENLSGKNILKVRVVLS